MSQYAIPLTSSASQTFGVTLSGQSYTACLEWRSGYGLFLSPAAGGILSILRPCGVSPLLNVLMKAVALPIIGGAAYGDQAIFCRPGPPVRVVALLWGLRQAPPIRCLGFLCSGSFAR